MTEQSVQDLLELSRRYPFFASPLVVLSKYLKEQHSDRYEDILYKTALRVPDREWLHSLLHTGMTVPGNISLQPGASEMQETGVEPEESRDSFGDSPGADIIEEIDAVEEVETAEEIEAMEEIEELLAEVDFKNEEPAEETSIDIYPEPETDTYGSDEEEDAETDLPPDFDDADESIAEEPQSGDALLTPGITETPVADTHGEPILDPDITRETSEELTAIEQLLHETDVHAPVTILEQPSDLIQQQDQETTSKKPQRGDTFEDDQVFEEISDFSAHHTHFAPAVQHEIAEEELPALDPAQEASLMESLNEIEGLLQKGGGVDLVPDVDQRPRPRLISQAAVYDIENYFPVSADANTPPTDFYSWLSNPGFSGRPDDSQEGDEEKKFRHDKLLNRFIETNPSISRPQKDFFNPVDAAKRSEQMPLELATETLAQVYLGQANFQGAIKIYEQLMRNMPEKKPYFAAQIKKIKKENNL